MRIRRFGLVVILGIAALIWMVGRYSMHPAGHLHSAAHAQKEIYYCPMHPSYTSDRPGDCPICSMKLVKKKEREREKKILYWTDPMIPGYKSDKPGKSPMGMDLIPVYEEGSEPVGPEKSHPQGYAAVQLNPEKRQRIGLKTTPAGKRAMVRTIRTVGRVEVDQTRIVHAHPKVEGWVDQIFAKYEGDAVKKGQPLFSIYSPDFVSTQQEYLTALKMWREIPAGTSPDVQARLKENVDAARKRLLWWDVSEEQIEILEKRGTPAKAITLNSPIDGVVLKKHVWPGEYMERGGDYYHIGDLSTVWVDVSIYEMDLPLVQAGEEALVTLPREAPASFRGRIVYVSPLLDSETRTATARLEFPNPDGRLRPGMYANAEIRVDLGERLAVPQEAVFDTGARRILFVEKSEGILEPREVETGARADGYVEILKGVQEGESVVVNGNFLLDSESRLKSALEGMEGGGHTHGP